jgi:2'-hydroxyisoflavone reductase
VKILVLGGTRFMGRHFVETAVARGHEVTLFNRGKTNPDLFQGIERLVGDRDFDLKPLQGRSWDVALDTCGYVPRIVRKSAELLTDSVEHYTFISSINAYAKYTEPGMDESAELARIDDESIEEITGKTYGPLKVLCEKAVQEVFPNRSAVLRCGLIVGPHDPTDRFTYWPVRISLGSQVLCPSPRDRQVQFIDARDLAEFILRTMESRANGSFNVTGPERTLTMEGFLDECNLATGGEAELVWASEEFVTKNDMVLPVWVPEAWVGMLSVSIDRALGAGLRFRPLRETIRDTLEWHATRFEDYELKTGLKPDRERELLKAWRRTSPED